MDQRSYSKGYSAGMKRVLKDAWPDYAPPAPPADQIGEIVEAAKILNDAAHYVLSVIEPDTAPFKELARARDDMDKVFTKLSDWLKSLPLPDSANGSNNG